MSTTDVNEDSGSEDEVLKRLLELKEMYKVHREELGGEGHSNEDSSGDAKSNTRKPRTKRQAQPQRQAEQKLSALQSVILQTVEEHGGLCHAETIIEYVRLKWPELRRHDSTLSHTSDCRKVVDANLHGFNLFTQHEQDGYWCINEKWEEESATSPRTSKSADDEVEGLLLLDLDSDFGKQVPITDLITQAIENRQGGCNVEDIYAHVLRNWERPYLRRSLIRRGLTDDDIRESIQVVLRTDPRYSRDPYNPDVYSVAHDHNLFSSKKSRNRGRSSPTSLGPRTMSPVPSGSLPRVPSHEINRPRSNSTKRPRSQSTPNARVNSISPPLIPPNPPAGYQCLCGAREPGGTRNKWHTSQGHWLCHTCGPAWSKKNSCPKCGKVYRNADAKYAIENSWICCDDCNRWVMTKCDGIEDLSIYDDANPDHIHYSCPLCRSIRIRIEEEKNRPPEPEKEKEEHEHKSDSPHTPSPALPILPTPQVKPVSAIHVIHPIGLHNSPIPSPIPASTSSPRMHYAESPTQHLLAPIARIHIGSFGRSPNTEREDDIDTLMKMGASTPPVTKIATPVKIGPTTKIGPIMKIDTKLKSKPPAKRSRAHEDGQELTAEILSNMPMFSPTAHPSTPPTISSPRGPIASISRPIQVQSQPIQVQSQPIQVQTQAQSQSHHQLQFPLSPPGQFQSSPIQFGAKIGHVQPQFGLIQPTGLFAHLTQTAQLLPQPPAQPGAGLSQSAPTQGALHMQYQFHQAHFKQPPPPVATPIKYDYVREERTTPTANDVITRNAQAAPAQRTGDAHNFERDTTDTQMAEADSATRSPNIDEMDTGSTLDEDLRIFKESLEQERKAIWANYNI